MHILCVECMPTDKKDIPQHLDICCLFGNKCVKRTKANTMLQFQLILWDIFGAESLTREKMPKRLIGLA